MSAERYATATVVIKTDASGRVTADLTTEDLATWQASTYARGQLLSPDDVASLKHTPCIGALCEMHECLPCGFRRMDAEDGE